MFAMASFASSSGRLLVVALFLLSLFVVRGRRLLTLYEDYEACACTSNSTSGGVAVNVTDCFADNGGILLCYVTVRENVGQRSVLGG